MGGSCGSLTRMRVLVFPGGTEIGLEIWSALRDCKDVELVSAGVEQFSHAPYVYSEFYKLPGVYEEGWIPELNRLIEKLHIDYIYPAHDDVILALAEHASGISAAAVMSPPDTCRITRYKSKTYDALRGALPIPRIYSNPSLIDAFPVFCKPDRGQGAYRARRVDDGDGLAADFQQGDLLLEYLPGAEYTVDCFSDRDRGLLFVGGRERERIRNGIAVATRPVEDPAFEIYARAISERLALHGAWFFQLKRDREGVLKLLEVGPRIAGSMALYRVLGINFPLLSLYEQRRLPLRILRNDARISLNRALVNRYTHDLVYRTVYVDLDDTLILRGRVNARLVALLYQCLNRGVRLILLTRHAGNLKETLDRYRLAQLFDEIVHLSPDQPKADAIRDRSAIFIDDSFSERVRVQEATGVPTFDCSMIEILLDVRQPAAETAASPAVSCVPGMNILFTSAGRRGYLLRYFKEALAGNGLVHAGNNSIAPAFVDADRSVITPSIRSEEYIDFLLSYCARHAIKAVIPLFDLDIPVLAHNADRFRQAGIVLVAPSEQAARICNDKWETFRYLRKIGLHAPLTFLGIESARLALARGEVRYPLIVKPRWGNGSIGLYRAEDERELAVFFEATSGEIERSHLKHESAEAPENAVLVQELAAGEEYNLDVVNDLDGNYVATFAKRKLAMRAGETDSAVTVNNPILTEVGRALSSSLKHKGNLDVDVFLNGGVASVLEMNPRFGGGYPFAHLAGVDLPRAILSWIQGNAADPACFHMEENVRGVKVILPARQPE